MAVTLGGELGGVAVQNYLAFNSLSNVFSGSIASSRIILAVALMNDRPNPVSAHSQPLATCTATI